MLSTRSAFFAADDVYNRPLISIVLNHIVEGTPDIIRVKELILTNWIKAKSENGSPRFGELTQYVSHWMGFAFWTPEVKFNIGEHVKLKGSESGFTTETQLTRYMNELSLKPYEKYKSPWELIIVPKIVRERFDDRKPRSAVVINFHHCLTDGFGLLTLMSKISSSVVDSGVKSKSPEKKLPARQQKISLGGICKGVYFLLRAPYDFISYIFVKVDPIKSNSWHLPEAELEKEWTISPATEHISSDLVKEIKNGYGVSFNAVILAAFTGSIRNVMLCHPTKNVPDFIRVSVPLPVSPHPGTLRNIWTATVMKLPVGEKCPRKRLMYVEERLEKMKKSPLHSVLFNFMAVAGGLFPFLIRPLLKIKNVTVAMSNLPGPKNSEYLLEKKLVYMEFFLGVGPGNIGIALSSWSYDGIIRVGATMDNGLIFSSEDVPSLANNVLKQLLILKDYVQEEA
ncbi:unnamed protein product [Allacma fusca]|uniref:Diacylglycerol O-acyltransferase n=1 Tax=Allacma fusca TaxID=39272 RepID=A0A8J2KXA9_9HEXA|nr:unnamed protein product [Allacma fusca]